MSSAVVTLDQRGTSGRFTEELVIYALQVCDVRPKKTAREWEKARAHDEPVIEGAYKFRLMRGPTCIVEVLMPTAAAARAKLPAIAEAARYSRSRISIGPPRRLPIGLSRSGRSLAR